MLLIKFLFAMFILLFQSNVYAYEIGVKQISDLGSYTDSRVRQAISESITGVDYSSITGIFSLTTGYVIPTSTEEINWNTVYGWGNHASVGYFVKTSDTLDNITAGETNVHLTATLKSNYDTAYTNNHAHSNKSVLDSTQESFTTPLKGNYDTAYGWGNHADAGYLNAESDPKIGTLVNNKWCTSDGSKVVCDADAPATSESDPIFTDWDKSTGISISSIQISDWNTATSSYITGNQNITLSGDVTGSGTTSITTTISTAMTEVSGTSQSASINTRYILTGSSKCTVTLPSTASVGQWVEVYSLNTAGYRIAQNANQYIRIGNQVTTTGTGGYVENIDASSSIDTYSFFRAVCIVANNGWIVTSGFTYSIN